MIWWVRHERKKMDNNNDQGTSFGTQGENGQKMEQWIKTLRRVRREPFH
jgi:ribosomal protein L19E